MSASKRMTLPGAQPALSSLHDRSIALQFLCAGREVLVVGRGVYEHHSELGAVLRIDLPQGAGCEVLIAEDSWTGEIRSGEALGCDFLIRLDERRSAVSWGG
jgi:hypothetical protein